MSILNKIDTFLNEGNSNKTLIDYKLQDGMNNKYTFVVVLKPDSALYYLYYSSWGPSGMPNAISNLQLKENPPISIKGIKNINDLDKKITKALESSMVTTIIKKKEIINKDITPININGDQMTVSEGIKYLKTLKPNQKILIKLV